MGREAKALKTRTCSICGEPIRFAQAAEIADHAQTCQRMKALNLVSGRASYSIVRLDDEEE